ncbi:nascent polypeptide-associated complex protein [Candidatus Pacearchaeota archaeon]|nr:nascent polypeptide-associated complex protein [Candidatus Pacearchaeota archaeon]
MFPGVNPSQMKALMKQMGLKQEDIEAERVVIEKSDGNRIVISPANVQKITMQGQDSWQVTGEAREETGIRTEDIRLVMEKTGVSEKDARDALEKTGDIAEAILSLS